MTELIASSTTVLAAGQADWLRHEFLCFVGKLGGLAKRDVREGVQANGGKMVALDDPRLSVIVLGADSFPFNLQQLDETILQRIDEGQTQVIEETEFWQRCQSLETADRLSQLHTPAMLADLLQIPVRQVRRWHRLGLIQPAFEVHRLPYFDFQEVASARRLVRWLSASSAEAIEQKLVQLDKHLPGVRRPLSQLPIIVEGSHVLLRQISGLVDHNGQQRFDFFAQDDDDLPDPNAATVLAFANPNVDYPQRFAPGTLNVEEAKHAKGVKNVEEANWKQAAAPERFLQAAIACEDEQDWEQAIEIYRSMMMAFGPSADVCFQIAELLYRQGDLAAARERYYMAIELDDDFLEARANLGCVLAELQQWELAVAAFEGALHLHPEYADVLFHLASALDELDRREEADRYWERFLNVAPNSPWAMYARARRVRQED